MYVCHCRAVTDRRICEAIEAGACDAETVRRRCGAGAGCGGCVAAVQALLADYGRLEPARPVADHAAA
jgi:bacterioferritin-associated ferredoxin